MGRLDVIYLNHDDTLGNIEEEGNRLVSEAKHFIHDEILDHTQNDGQHPVIEDVEHFLRSMVNSNCLITSSTRVGATK